MKLQRSWKEAKKSMKEVQENMKQQHNKKKKSSKIEGWRQYMVGKQEYPFKQTFKEAGPK